jgi:phosphatidate cytidylyltransferase
MNPAARERLFGYHHALDQRVVLVLVLVIAAILVVAPLVMLLLAKLGKTGADLRGELVRRYLSWLMIAPAVIVPVLLGAFWTILVVMVLSILCYREFARATGLFREKTMSAMVVIGICAVTFATLDHWYNFFVALTPLTIILIAAVALLADRPKGYVQRVGLASLSFLLFGVCLAHLGFFANDARYRGMLMLLFIVIAINDVFAFVVGKSIGGPKLCPNTSPNKTVSGALGALVLSTLLFAALGRFVFEGTAVAMPHHLILLGAVVSIAGQCGDLAISSVKRDVGIKDMGNVLPGHGGVLDRCNSLLLSAPAAFHYLRYYADVAVDGPTRIFTGT